MLWFNPAKRLGFIRTDDGERLQVDEGGFGTGQLVGDRWRGTRVSFERIDGDVDGDARAVNVTVLPLFPERRARSRGRR